MRSLHIFKPVQVTNRTKEKCNTKSQILFSAYNACYLLDSCIRPINLYFIPTKGTYMVK